MAAGPMALVLPLRAVGELLWLFVTQFPPVKRGIGPDMSVIAQPCHSVNLTLTWPLSLVLSSWLAESSISTSSSLCGLLISLCFVAVAGNYLL